MLTRALPLVAVAAAAFAGGAITATAPGRAEHRLVSAYTAAWTHRDYARMYSLLSKGDRADISQARFAAAYRDAAATATLTAVTVVRIGEKANGAFPVAMRVRTKLFGTLNETLSIPLAGSGSGAKVRYDPALLFPGLRAGETLSRTTILAPRASLLAYDGTPLAQGPDRSSPIPDVADQIAGSLGPIPAAQKSRYVGQGYPADAKVGIDGLERIFQKQLAGVPGGTLLAGKRALAHRSPVAGRTVKTSIDPTIERAAVSAMAGRYAGIVAMDPRTGELLAVSGVAFSALQPPGSTMKIITAAAALDAGTAKLDTTFPVQTGATIDGFTLQNAGGEACGGTLVNAFAVSCNSVFAPLGAKVGAAKLVAMAEKFGFNQPSAIPGAGESTIPPANKIGDDLAVGSSAIGQGLVESTALGMTDVGATIAMGGRRPVPTLIAGGRPRFRRVVSKQIAGEVEQMMVAVVTEGTGTAAQISGVEVAGKTGTAELRDTSDPNDPNANAAENTDAWFVGYAPVGKPRIVVGALFPNQGAGGDTAAPAVQQVLVAGLAHVK